MNKNNIEDGIVLLSKRTGETSFSSLYNVKKALGTKKVGHTGTLDSFASGLLVICTGKLTKLVSNITEFDKTYEAVLKFGEETDTLEYTGSVIKKTDLPDLAKLEEVLQKYKGEMLQKPPIYSAIHIDGKRASDLARKGVEADIPKRKINIFKSEIKEIKLVDNKVEYVRIFFSVSKGTYIRSLARDIGLDCNSSAHLVGLRRYSVGNFRLENAAGYSLLNEFTIDNVLKENMNPEDLKQKDEDIKLEIKEKILNFNEKTSNDCNFSNLIITSDYINDFKNGKKILNSWFEKANNNECIYSVFSVEKIFLGLIEYKEKKYFYKFVINS